MNKIETFFESRSYDSKNITNKSDVVISQETLDELESNGATYEFLESLNVPVFKYMTQITIHGLFPELMNHRIGGYKNLFQNKNKSIGVKYTAIDRYKKKLIYNICAEYGGWFINSSSTEYSIRKTKRVFSKEDYMQYLPDFKAIYDRIDKTLFVGSVDLYLAKGLMCNYLVLEVDISLVKESNVTKVIENILDNDIESIKAFIENERIKKEKEQNEYLENHKRIEEEKEKFVNEAKKSIKFDELKTDEVVLYDGLKVLQKVEYSYDNTIRFVYRKYIKSPRQKKFRYVEAWSDKFPETNLIFSSFKQETMLNKIKNVIIL